VGVDQSGSDLAGTVCDEVGDLLNERVGYSSAVDHMQKPPPDSSLNCTALSTGVLSDHVEQLDASREEDGNDIGTHVPIWLSLILLVVITDDVCSHLETSSRRGNTCSFCRAMLYTCGLCCRAVSVRQSV